MNIDNSTRTCGHLKANPLPMLEQTGYRFKRDSRRLCKISVGSSSRRRGISGWAVKEQPRDITTEPQNS